MGLRASVVQMEYAHAAVPAVSTLARRDVECPPEMKIAIASVESKRWGWMAITKPSDRIAHPDCAKRVAEIEAELRVMFDLVDD
jgi:hypothetical protein